MVWQSDKLISPKIVPVINTMDSTAGWQTLKDGRGSNISISSCPARNGLGVRILYDLKEGGWVGISRNVNPEVLSQAAGLNFSCYAANRQSTVELRLAYNNSAEFGYSWKPDLGKWDSLQALYEDFKCRGLENNCSPPNSQTAAAHLAASRRGMQGAAAG